MEEAFSTGIKGKSFFSGSWRTDKEEGAVQAAFTVMKRYYQTGFGAIDEALGQYIKKSTQKTLGQRLEIVSGIANASEEIAGFWEDLHRRLTAGTDLETAFGQLLEVVTMMKQIGTSIDAILHPLSEYQAAMKAVNDQFDAWIMTLTNLSATEEQIKGVEEDRIKALEKTQLTMAQDIVTASLADAQELNNAQIARISQSMQSVAESVAISRSGLSEADWFMSQIQAARIGTDQSLDDLAKLADLTTRWYSAATQERSEQVQAQNSALADTVRAAQEAADRWINVKNTTGDLISSIMSGLMGIKYSGLNIALPGSRVSSAASDFQSLIAQAKIGGPEDVQAAISFASTYLTEAQARYKSSAEYQGIYKDVTTQLSRLQMTIGGADFQSRLFESLATSQTNTYEATKEVEADLTDINNTFTSFQGWINKNADNQLSKLDINNDLLRELVTANKKPMIVTVEVGGQEFDAYIANIADTVRVQATRREATGKIT